MSQSLKWGFYRCRYEDRYEERNMIKNKIQKRRKILMLIPQLGYGGAEKSFVRLANFLSRYHMVTVVLFDDDFGDSYAVNSAESLFEGINVIFLESDKRRFVRWFNRWKNFRMLKKEADITISFLSGTNILNVLTGTQTPSIVSERGSKKFDINITGWKRVLLLKFLDPLVYSMASKIVTVSKGLSSEILENRKHTLNGKVIAIEGYVDSQMLVAAADEEIETEFDILKSYPTVVASGRLSKQKGYNFLLDAFAEVKKVVPNSKLFFIGDGPEFDGLKILAGKLGLSITQESKEYVTADVVFAGYRHNPSRYFRIGHVFAFPSLYEGLPNALIEAVGSGVPVLAADCPWGVRSVLIGSSAKPTNDCLPIDTASGSLMPMINGEKGIEIWTERLIEALRVVPKRPSYEERLTSIERFDLNQTGLQWLEVIDETIKQKKKRGKKL